MSITKRNMRIESSHHPMRQRRIERWASKGQDDLTQDKSIGSSNALGTALIQTKHRLNMDLLRLGEQREKLIERRNFDQKIFASKQVLRHKNDENILRTLSYVHKCCKFMDENDRNDESIDPTKFLYDKKNRTIRSRQDAQSAPTHRQNLTNPIRTPTGETLAGKFLKHNRKFIELSRKTPSSIESSEILNESEAEKRHVQFSLASKYSCQSAHFSRSSRSSLNNTVQNKEQRIRDINSAPPTKTIDSNEDQVKPAKTDKRPLARLLSAKSSLQEFRQYPERFLSKSNRYLPLLRYQAFEIRKKALHLEEKIQKLETQNPSIPSTFSDGSALIHDDVKSFISEDIDGGKSLAVSNSSFDNKQHKKFHSSSKINLMETLTEDKSQRTMALARLRNREYAHLHTLINSKSMEHILQPFSENKTRENELKEPISLENLLQSIDSLNCSTRSDERKRRQIDFENNLLKLGILLF